MVASRLWHLLGEVRVCGREDLTCGGHGAFWQAARLLAET